MDHKDKFVIKYFLNGEPFASRMNKPAVPRAGDNIRFKDGEYYVVTLVVWCEDEEDHYSQRVNIDLIKYEAE